MTKFMKNEIKKFWLGKISLGKSFWLWYVVGGTILTLPAWLVPDTSLQTAFSLSIFILYCFSALVVIIFLMIGDNTQTDIAVARKYGIKSALVLDGFNINERKNYKNKKLSNILKLLPAKPNFIIKNISV